MKNIYLLVIAILLGIFTYFYQELGDRREFREKQTEGQILNPEELGELTGFSLPKVKLTKQGSLYQFLESGELVDERRVEWFMKILAGVKVKRQLSKEELKGIERESFFPDEKGLMEFSFVNGKVTYLLGKKLDFDRSFYMEVKTKKETNIVIAYDSGDHEAIYDKGNAHRSDHHYQRLLSLMYLEKDFFRDYRLFRHWMNKKWSLLEVTFTGGRNRDYTLNFPKAITEPRAPTIIRLNTSAMGEFEKKLVALEGLEFYSGTDVTVLPPLGKAIVNSTMGEAVLTLFPHPKKKDFYVIKSSLDGFSYAVKKEISKDLLGPVQQFWDLKLLSKRPEQMKVTFNGESKTVKFESKKGRFYATSDKGQAIHESFATLLKFLSRDASYWTQGPEIKDSAIQQFSLDWGKGEFLLMIRSGEVVLYHKRTMEALIYSIDGRVPFKVLKDEYFNE